MVEGAVDDVSVMERTSVPAACSNPSSTVVAWPPMVDDETRQRVQALLSQLRERPTEFPAAELLELAEQPLAIRIDRSGDEPVVFVSPRPDPRFDALSEREHEVATLVAAGFSNRQIAEALFISLATVKDHVHAILAKTGLESRAQVAAAWYGTR
ncbi:MAG: helix-turn-helix transcriptional regulator [Actinomycetota bacterium]